jgi:F1F0 ATPase subunit 2
MKYVIAAAMGLLLGVFFYGGLWLTVHALLRSRYPVLLTISSFWARTLVTLGGFLFAMNGSWQNAIVCLAGFGLGRLAVSLLVPRDEGLPRCT